MANIYVVATPIGNLKDITFRAVETLKNSDLIICEDTRVTQKLLNTYEIKTKLTDLNDFNEENKTPEILHEIRELENISIVSDAGTPLISDPGYRFIKEALKQKHRIIPIPGPSSILAALVTSGMPTNSFTFLGFLSKSSSKQEKILHGYKGKNHTIILFESPHRIEKTLQILLSVYGDILVSVSRELTKKFEEVKNSPISKHLEDFKIKKPKGEFTLIFNPSVKES